jgi:hypothetical protein
MKKRNLTKEERAIIADHNLKYGRAAKALRGKRKRSFGKNPCGKK